MMLTKPTWWIILGVASIIIGVFVDADSGHLSTQGLTCIGIGAILAKLEERSGDS